MKNFRLIFLATMVIFAVSCASQSGPKISSEMIAEMINKDNFTFMAQRANPTNAQVYSLINSMSGGNSARMMSLDYGYTLNLDNEKLTVDLPYFGKRYQGGYENNDKNGIKFVSENVQVEKSQNKKGNWVYTLYPKDVQHIGKIYVEIFKNGNAYVSVDANDRQPISYDGYLMQN